MSTRNYLVLCGVVTAVWVIALLAVPPFARFIEQIMLLFLSRNAG